MFNWKEIAMKLTVKLSDNWNNQREDWKIGEISDNRFSSGLVIILNLPWLHYAHVLVLVDKASIALCFHLQDMYYILSKVNPINPP